MDERKRAYIGDMWKLRTGQIRWKNDIQLLKHSPFTTFILHCGQ